MTKKLFAILLTVCVLCAFSASASAEGWIVTFESNGRMGGNLTDGVIEDAIGGMQPGDTQDFTVTVQNNHARTTRWYMRNEVLSSLERVAEQYGFGIGGGAYSYVLTYYGPSGSRELYNSDRLGGEGNTAWEREGLEGATSNLEDYFYLDTLNSGESGVITLTVHLEGESQGNDYQNTAAELVMRFAVELADGGGTTEGSYPKAVKTGDENNLTPYYIGMIIAGLLFLYLALDAFTDRLYKKGVD